MSAPEGITLRRAIEICMSRLRMHEDMRRTMAAHLTNAIANDGSPPDKDTDALRATLEVVLDLTSVDDRYTKSQLLSRVQMIRSVTERTLR